MLYVINIGTGTDYETAVQNLISMGFERSEVIDALNQNFNNPDRAASYLAVSTIIPLLYHSFALFANY